MKQYLLIIFLIQAFLVHSQSQKGLNTSANIYYGNIIRHRNNLKYEQPNQVYGFSLCFSQKSFGKKEWEYFHRYPEVGVGIAYINLGDKYVLGEAIGFMGQISYNMFRNKIFSLNGEVAIGVGFVSRHYDKETNPTNNAIGSSINNMTIAKLNGSFRLNSQLSLLTAVAVTHLSNGALKLPNLGINALETSIGLKYNINPVLSNKDYIRYDQEKNKISKKIGFQIQFNFGARALSQESAKVYPIHAIYTKGEYRYNKILKWQAGLGYEFRDDVYKKYQNQLTRSKSKRLARRYMIIIGQELVFDKLGLFGEAGLYLPKKDQELEKPFYFKVGARYYLPIQPRLFLEGYIKTHLFTGDHFSLGLGIAL